MEGHGHRGGHGEDQPGRPSSSTGNKYRTLFYFNMCCTASESEQDNFHKNLNKVIKVGAGRLAFVSSSLNVCLSFIEGLT